MCRSLQNVTSGNWAKAIDGVLAAADPHSFIGASYGMAAGQCGTLVVTRARVRARVCVCLTCFTSDGRMAHIETRGNPACHVVLRGGDDKPNYSVRDIQDVAVVLLVRALWRTYYCWHTQLRVLFFCSAAGEGAHARHGGL